MSLDVDLKAPRIVSVFEGNITHNLNRMAKAAGIYEVLWRPEECVPPITHARQLIEPLRLGIAALEGDPDYFRREYNPPNGWGNYEVFVGFVREYLAACIENPDASVEVSR